MRNAIITRPGMRIILGRQGENEVQPIWFPVAEWKRQHGDGVLTLIHQRSGDEQGYPVALTIGNEYAEWLVSSADVAKPGVGRCELVYTVGGAVAKSAIWETYVFEAVDGSGEPPEPWESWVEQLTGELEKVVDMTVQAETLSAGSDATVTKTVGDVVNLKFGIPRGQKGSKGDQGEQGIQGIQGIPGQPGADGLDGVSPSVEITDVPGGHNVVITDAEGEHSFDVMDGTDGQPGTPGADGEPGADGKSAYQSAQDGGYTGTEAQFNADLADVPNKVDKITGKGLSTNDYTDEDKTKVANALTEHQSLAAYRTAEAQDVIDSRQDSAISGKYTKPSTGIPKTDLAAAVQTSLGKADSALQSYTETDPTVPAWAKEGSKPDYSAGEIAFGGTNVYDELIAINGLISDQATSTNKLVSASEMGDAIMAVEAKQLYATAAQGSFSNKAALTSATVFYDAGGTIATPTKNDVAYVLADESHSNKSAKYVVASTNPIVWGFVITFSDATFSQAQMDAVNSGITSVKRAGYDSHIADSTVHVTNADKTAWDGKEDAISDLATIRAGASAGATAVQPESGKGLFSGSYNDLTDKPTIPSAVTESTVAGWGFTKNTGTYSKPSTGIPKTDLASAVQTSLGKADSALQEHQAIKTLNGQTLTGSGNIALTGVPASTTADNGKFLRVVNGSAAWATVPVMEGGSY